ncbi:MAG TPA: PEP-CTERM sorting domain-containing protein [Roseateles sp.]|uniref:PEP-CTERM sorting domain-containing protein n=1 Tax=Roseateles sp. TaxID=1971397 RepID=UPI002EDB4747
MKTRFPLRAAAVLAALTAALPAWAQTTLAPGGTASGTVTANTSIYQLFGHSGTVHASQAATTASAPYYSFAASDGSSTSFSFESVTGGVNCCGNPAALSGADGYSGSTNVLPLNGLSGIFGNTQLGLVAVFTSEADPFGQTAPASLNWNASTQAGTQSPLLNQVFFVGDGHAGLNKPAGQLLSFVAPAGATRLYIGFADSYSFSGLPGYYSDNRGELNYTLTLSAPVPEPASALLALAGVGLLVATRRRQGA